MPVVVIACQKGGSGKTTIATALAGALFVLKGLPVRLVDADPQETAAMWWAAAQAAAGGLSRAERARQEKPHDKKIADELRRVQRTIAMLQGLQLVKHTAPDLHKHSRLDTAGEIVIVDCAGRLDANLRSALIVADYLIVPMRPTYPDAWALGKLAEQLDLAQQHRKTPLPAGVLLNQLQLGTTLGESAVELAQAMPPGFFLLGAQLRNLADFQLAMGHGCTPLELHPFGKAASDLRQLVDVVTTELGKLK